MADPARTEADTILQNITRHVSCLGDGNRSTRKRSVEGIRKEIFGQNVGCNSEVLDLIFGELVKPLVKIMSDPVEKCREVSISIINDFLLSTKNPQRFLHLILPALVQRLGQQDMTEQSEEVRLKLVEMLSVIAGMPSSEVAPFTGDFVQILARTIVDPYPEVKKQSCKCASSLAKSVPQHFHLQSESLIRPLLQCITHQHSRVRVEVIGAIGNVIQYGNGKSVDDVVSHLAQRLFDSSPAVRESVIQVVGTWLLDLPDRYSFHHKLIPLLLTGVTDEMPQIQEQASDLWHDIGLKYQGENENDLKEKMDFMKPDVGHYPQGVERPNLGCRTLVYRNFSKILSGLSRDITDWVVDTRVKSAKLLYVLILNNEENATQHLEKILQVLYKAANDEEDIVQQYVMKSSVLIGYFVPCEVWVKMVLANLKASQSVGAFKMLAVLRGCTKESLSPFLVEICATLSDPDICRTSEAGQQVALLCAVEDMMTVCGEDVQHASLSLFAILITVLALSRHEEFANRCDAGLARLAAVQGLPSTISLYEAHAQSVLSAMREDYQQWTQHSLDRMVFDTLILKSGPVVGQLLQDIMPVLTVNLNSDKDPSVRLKFFSLLTKLLMTAATTVNSHNKLSDFTVPLVRSMILPNCVWTAGRVAAAVRTAAMSCLWALLQCDHLNAEQLLPVMEEMTTQLRTTLEDSNVDTRLLSCRVFTHLFNLLGKQLDQHALHNMYPDFLKRLDDSSDVVRVAICKTFIAYFDSFLSGFDVSLYRSHVEEVYKGLLVHLDDPDKNIQTAVLDVLFTAAVIEPDMLIKLVESVKHKHRSTKLCDQLEQFIYSLPKNKANDQE